MRNERDFYPTPHSIIDALLPRLNWLPELVWEPCAGDGRLADAMRQHNCKVVTHDIVTGHDFFNWKQAQAQALVTNPPFKIIRQFIDHAFSIGVQHMALICNERLWACGKGFDQWQRHRPSRFVNLTWREDYLGKGGTPDRALAISIWDTPLAHECSFEVWNRDLT